MYIEKLHLIVAYCGLEAAGVFSRVEKSGGNNGKITARPHMSLAGVHGVQVHPWPCFKSTSRI